MKKLLLILSVVCLSVIMSCESNVPKPECETQNYGIYRGTLPWSTYNHVPITCSTSGLTTATITADTGNYYYLVVAQNGCSEHGSYGRDSSGIEIPVSSAPCYSRRIGTCN